ncbi:MAG: DUF885 family protein, partial [Candidatus Binatia bacterium]
MSKFSEFCDAHFKKHFELHPTDAIYYGIEGYDHLLNDYSDDTYQAEKAFIVESLSKLRQVSAANLNPDEAVDYALLEGKLTLQAYEHAKEDYRLKSPDIYMPVDAIYILTVRATSDLMGNLLSRLNRTPAVIRQGIANLSRTGANPPKLWTANAVEGAKGGMSFLDNLRGHSKIQAAVKNTAALQAAIETAKNALGEFATFLERDLLPRSRGAYAVGEEHFNLLLTKKHFLNHDAASLLALGEDLFARTKEELESIAAELAPGKGIEAVAKDIQERHPSIDEVLPAYQKAMEAARDFVKKKNLVSFPPKEELHVVHTPEFRRHEIPFAAYLSPSPKDPDQVGYYYV